MDGGMSTNAHVVDAVSVLNVDDVSVGGADKEVRGLGESLESGDADPLLLEVGDLALVQDIELLLSLLNDRAVQSQPREVDLGEGPALKVLAAADLANEGIGTLATIGKEDGKLLALSKAEDTLLDNPALGLGGRLGSLDKLSVGFD